MNSVHLRRTLSACYGVCVAGLLAGTGCVDDRESGDGEGAIASAITLDPNANYTIVGAQSTKCVGVVDASKASNARLEIRTCSGNASQRFHPEAMGGGVFRLRSELSGLCVDVLGASLDDGALVIQFTCGTGTNQQWSFTDLAGGTERITARHSGKVLDVTGTQTADGTLIEQWASNNGANQQFTLVRAVAPLL